MGAADKDLTTSTRVCRQIYIYYQRLPETDNGKAFRAELGLRILVARLEN